MSWQISFFAFDWVGRNVTKCTIKSLLLQPYSSIHTYSSTLAPNHHRFPYQSVAVVRGLSRESETCASCCWWGHVSREKPMILGGSNQNVSRILKPFTPTWRRPCLLRVSVAHKATNLIDVVLGWWFDLGKLKSSLKQICVCHVYYDLIERAFS